MACLWPGHGELVAKSMCLFAVHCMKVMQAWRGWNYAVVFMQLYFESKLQLPCYGIVLRFDVKYV